MIRVCHFVHRLPPEYSGAGAQALALAEALEAAGDVRSRIVAYTDEPGRDAPATDLPVTLVPLARGIGKLRQRAELDRAIGAGPEGELLHVHGYHRPALRAAARRERPVVLKTTLLGVDDARAIAGRGPLHRRALASVARVVSLTPALAAANRGTPEVTIPNGVDLERFRPGPRDPATRAALDIPPEATVLLFLGGDDERKGFGLLPDFWRELAPRTAPLAPHLVVAGRQRDPARVAAFLRDAGPNVHAPGIVDAAAWLRAADALLVLSTREGLPNAVLEALASGCYVCALAIDGTYDGWLESGSGLLLERADAAGATLLAARLAAGVHRGVEPAAVRERLDLRRIADRYRGLYAEVLAERGVHA